MPTWLSLYLMVGCLLGGVFGAISYLGMGWDAEPRFGAWCLIVTWALLVGAFWPICIFLALLGFALYKLGIID